MEQTYDSILGDDRAFAAQMRNALQSCSAEGTRPVNACGSEVAVQRTRRLVRQQAAGSRLRQHRLTAILAASLVCSALLAVFTVPLWNLLDELAHWSGIPDLQIHMLFLAVWFLPGTAVMLLLWRGYRKEIASLKS